MGRPKLSKAKRKSKTVWARVTDETYHKLLVEAGDNAKKIPEVLRSKLESQ